MSSLTGPALSQRRGLFLARLSTVVGNDGLSWGASLNAAPSIAAGSCAKVWGSPSRISKMKPEGLGTFGIVGSSRAKPRQAKTTVTESVSMGRSRPKEKHQHDSPNDAPYSPSDVGVFRLPFQDSFVKGHDKYPSLLSSHDIESHEALIASTVKDSHVSFGLRLASVDVGLQPYV